MSLLSLLLLTQMDGNFLNQTLWDDGQAEVAFYFVVRSENQYGKPEEQTFIVGTYLVKHDYDTGLESKAHKPSPKSKPAFKSALFYELESGSYQYKRNWVVNVGQPDLVPFKSSFTCFDWCSNTYRELVFNDKSFELLLRSDDYGNQTKTINIPKDAKASALRAVPIASLPLLLRAIDFEKNDQVTFNLVDDKGQTTEVKARLGGKLFLDLNEDRRQAEFIELTYSGQIGSLIGEKNALNEVFYRGVDPARTMLKWTALGGKFNMVHLESLRTAYWKENLYTRLKKDMARP